MSSFTEDLLRETLQELNTSSSKFIFKLTIAKLEVPKSESNDETFTKLETRLTDITANIMTLEASGKERQERKWRIPPEAFDSAVLADLRELKAQLDQLFIDLENFKTRTERHENINRMGMSSIEMLNLRASSTAQGNTAGGTNSRRRRRTRVEKTIHVREHWRRPPRRKQKSNASNQN